MTRVIPKGFSEVEMYNPFIDLVGPIYARIIDGRYELGIFAEERHNNPGSVIHGGLMMSLVDNLMGATIHNILGPRSSATISLNCDFLSATRAGEWISGIGEVTHHTRSMAFIQASLTADDRPIMTAAGVFKLMETPKPQEAS